METTRLPTVDEVVLLSEAAKTLDLSTDYVGALAKQGVLAGYQIGHIWVVTRASVEAYQADPAGARARAREGAEA